VTPLREQRVRLPLRDAACGAALYVEATEGGEPEPFALELAEPLRPVLPLRASPR
jgi:hypothetical protein